MKNKIVNILFVLAIGFAVATTVSSCANTGAKLPPVTVKGTIKGNPVKVVIYPDGSQPTEVEIGLEDEIVIDLDKE